MDKSDLTYIFSDVNSWGVLALGSDGPVGWRQALDFNRAHHHATITSKGITGQGISFGSDTTDIWLEGTGQMASAWNFVGDTASGNACAQQIALWQTTVGGIPYSVLGGPTGDGWNMPTSASVSATAWFILAARQVNPFATLPNASAGISRRIHVPESGRSALGPSDIQGRRFATGAVSPRRRLPMPQTTAGSTWSSPPSAP